MARRKLQTSTHYDLWTLVRRQHGVVTRSQLLGLGFSRDAIAHRLTKGRLHPVWRGVYAVGRPELTRRGIWMAAVLSCGPHAALSDESAGVFWRILRMKPGDVEVTVPAGCFRHRAGVVIHRRVLAPDDVTRHDGIPVTSPIRTLIDLAPRLPRAQLEAAVNEADKLDLTDPETLLSALDTRGRSQGMTILREVLDRRTFTLTYSELERRFVPVSRRAGLPLPQTGQHVNGFKVDFYWRELGLVVETDGLRYHRTPAQQARDRVRDQAHAAAGVTCLRFTRAQVILEPGHVQATLAAVARRLRVPVTAGDVDDAGISLRACTRHPRRPR